jgi:hypothetical protein
MKLIVDGSAALPKLQQQLVILKSAGVRFDSSLYDSVEIVQADLFDNELEAAKALSPKGFNRAAGAVAGVVLERHLGRVEAKHNLKITKNAPTIDDWNQLLKESSVIDLPTWRFIQHLADIRNLCDHAKRTEPTKEQIEDLVFGVTKIVRTVF